MKNIIALTFLLVSLISYSQVDSDTSKVEKKKFYTSSGGEWIFSFANTNQDIETTNLRFSAWFHAQFHWHYDFSKYMGGFFGLGSRNIGYTSLPTSNDVYAKGFTEFNAITGEYELGSNYEAGDKISMVKRRAYTLGIPIGLKIGKVDDNQFLFLGGEIEFPFHFKNKVWVEGEKEHIRDEWFSDQTNDYLLSAFIGFQFPWGTNIKFKWYFNDFINTDYKVGNLKPYADYKSQMFYFSIGMNMFNSQKSVKQLTTLDKKKKEQKTYNL